MSESQESVSGHSWVMEFQPQEPEVSAAEQLAPQPWGFWVTIGFSAVIAMATIFISACAAIAGIVILEIKGAENAPERVEEIVNTSPLAFSLLTILTAIPVVFLCGLFAKLKPRITLQEYFAVQRVSAGTLVLWSLVMVGFLLAEAVFCWIFNVPGSTWMEQMHSNPFVLPLVWFAIILVAPIAEEIFFRGFLFAGLVRIKWAGPVWAILITSVGWALMHMQYEPIMIFWIFLCGLLLGYARLKSGSLIVVIVMHILMNFIASVMFLAGMIIGS